MSVLNIGRGPECLNQLPVSYLFQQPFPDELSMSCIKEVQYFLTMLQNGDNGQLLDKNIIPSIDKAEYDLLRSSREKYLNPIQTITSNTIVVKLFTKFVMVYFIEGFAEI